MAYRNIWSSPRYYSIDAPGMMIVALLSLEGDADIYGSTSDKQPSYDSYEYMATSCGLDILVLPPDRAGRRVYIGVYGHVRHENTTYQLYIILPSDEDIRRYQVTLTQVAVTYHSHSKYYVSYMYLSLIPRPDPQQNSDSFGGVWNGYEASIQLK